MIGHPLLRRVVNPPVRPLPDDGHAVMAGPVRVDEDAHRWVRALIIEHLLERDLLELPVLPHLCTGYLFPPHSAFIDRYWEV